MSLVGYDGPGRSSWSCGYLPGTRPGSSGSCWSSGLRESVWLGGSGWYGVWGQAGLILSIFLLFELIQKYFQMETLSLIIQKNLMIPSL